MSRGDLTCPFMKHAPSPWSVPIVTPGARGAMFRTPPKHSAGVSRETNSSERPPEPTSDWPSSNGFSVAPVGLLRIMPICQLPTWTPEKLELVERLIAFAESRGHTILELAVSWLLAHKPVSSVIAGATSPEQIHANANAARWTLDDRI